MSWGNVQVKGGAVVTNHKTFLLGPLSVVTISRPFFAPSLFFALSGGGFTAAFADLLYLQEIISIAAICAVLVFAGSQIAQLRLHGSDLRGSTLGNTVWGRFCDLQSVRADIADKLAPTHQRDVS